MLDAFGYVATVEGSHLYRCASPRTLAAMDTLEHLGVNRAMVLIGSPVEAEWDLRQYGMTIDYLRFDVTRVSARGIISVANRLRRWLRTGATMVVCCKHGRTRTGLVVGAWRLLFDRWGIDDVERERVHFGGEWIGSADDVAIRFLLAQIEATPAEGRRGRAADIVAKGKVSPHALHV